MISDGCAHRASVATAPASMRAISRMFWNSRVRRSTSARIRSLCSSRSSAVSAGVLDVGRRDANGGERRPQIVAQRRQQRRLQLLALPGQLPRLALLEELRALDRDRDHAAERVERAGLDRPPGRGEQADGLGARRAGARAESSGRRSPSFDDRRRSARRRRIRARSERRQMRVEQLTRVQRDRHGPALEHLPLVRRAAAQSRRTPGRSAARSLAPGSRSLRGSR